MKYIILFILLTCAVLTGCRVKSTSFGTQPETIPLSQDKSPELIQLNTGGYTYFPNLEFGIRFNNVVTDKYQQTSDGLKRYANISLSIIYTGSITKTDEIKLDYGSNEIVYKLENKQRTELRIKDFNGSNGEYEITLSISSRFNE